MRKNYWSVFIVAELLLALLALWQALQGDGGALIFIIVSIFVLIQSRKIKRRRFLKSFIRWISALVLFSCLIGIPAIWMMVILAVLVIGLKSMELSDIFLFRNMPWNKKEIQMIKTEEPTEKSAKVMKNQWFGNQKIGGDIYEWDDLNLTIAAGDTIIDLGNTLLPKKENVILIRKGFGRTRILVPFGIGIMIDHSAITGSLTFDEKKYGLNNEQIRLYSEDYDTSTRTLKIVSNIFVGDVEVIRI